MELEQFIEDIQWYYPEEIDKNLLIDIFGTKEDIYKAINNDLSVMIAPDFLEALIFRIHSSLENYFDEQISFKNLKLHTKFLQELIHTLSVHGLVDLKDLESYLPDGEYLDTDRVVIHY